MASKKSNPPHLTRRDSIKWMMGASASLMLNSGFCNYNVEKMITRKIPSTGETIPIVGLGTWQSFDVGNSEAERNPLKEVLKLLVEAGGSVIDSSPMYGKSEKVVGDLTTELKLKSKIFEATKVWTTGKNEGMEQMYNSMSLMKAKPMDLMQVHNLMDWQTHIRTLKLWKAEKKIRYIGITHYRKGGYSEMEKIMKSEPLDFIQINYNLAVRSAEERILPLAKDKGIAVLINRPYEGGSLFQKIKGKELPDWASEFDCESWGQFFLKFILSHPSIHCVIPGTSKPKHMKDNTRAGFGKMPTKELRKRMIQFLEK